MKSFNILWKSSSATKIFHRILNFSIFKKIHNFYPKNLPFSTKIFPIPIKKPSFVTKIIRNPLIFYNNVPFSTTKKTKCSFSTNMFVENFANFLRADNSFTFYKNTQISPNTFYNNFQFRKETCLVFHYQQNLFIFNHNFHFLWNLLFSTKNSQFSRKT